MMNQPYGMPFGSGFPPTQFSGMMMQAGAPEFVPPSATEVVKDDESKKEQFNTNDSGLVDEDTDLTVTAQNRLLAATAFEQMRLDGRFIRALYEKLGFNRPSLIQAQAIPYILAQPRRHLIAQAQNGSGKTVCFSLGALSYVREEYAVPQVLILAHTRELIQQIKDVISQICCFTNIHVTCLAQGIPYDPAAQVVIGTVGAVRKAIVGGSLNYNNIVCMVIDEADEMLQNKAFAKDIRTMTSLFEGIGIPVQILLFSATFNEKVIKFANVIAPGAVQIRKATKELQIDTLLTLAIHTPSYDAKCQTLETLYQLMDVCQTCIFVNHRATADLLQQWLSDRGHKVGVIRGGDMEAGKRYAILESFRKGETKVLVTTDLLARGIDVLDVSLVIHFDIPMKNETVDCETFLHRSGRTGRMGRKGVCVTFMENGERDVQYMKIIEDSFNMPVEIVSLEDKEMFEKKVKTWIE